MLEKLAAEAAKWQPGDPLDPETEMGSMVDETQMERVLGYIGKGNDEGAELRWAAAGAGGDRRILHRADDLRGARNHMTIAQEEIFGPVAHRDHVRLRGGRPADRQRHGLRLSSAICTATSTRRTDSRARCAPGGVRQLHDWGGNSVPFGGYKQSGIGRDRSLHALEKYTQIKTTYINVLEA